MVYSLEAFVANKNVLEIIASQFQNARVVSLQQGFALTPITKPLSAELHRSANEHIRAFNVDGFWRLSTAVMELAALSSSVSSIVYLEAEIFGGVGTQAAIVWTNGKLTHGPMVTGNEPGMAKFPLREWAFNAALRLLGVTADNGKDEFDTVGLGLRRQTHEWA